MHLELFDKDEGKTGDNKKDENLKAKQNNMDEEKVDNKAKNKLTEKGKTIIGETNEGKDLK